ncbi:MAG: hypothetical protein AB1631_07955 [Acidobacteriota bacterium]
MSEETKFSGPYKEQLSKLAELIDWLWAEHDKSFVMAGDDKVYAFGGNGYLIVHDQSKWEGAIELMTPKAAMTVKPEGGELTIISSLQDEKAVKEAFEEGIIGVRQYYENRYWATPQTAK